MIRRSPITRRTPLKRTALKRKPKRRAVPSDIYQQVLARDMGCVGRAYLPFVQCYGRIDPHHVLRRSQGGQDTPDNLISLCRAHHSFVHDHPQQSYDLGLLKRPHIGDIQ